MNDLEKSDSATAAMKSPSKAGTPVAEAMERRAGTKGNAGQQSTYRTQTRARVTQALDREFGPRPAANRKGRRLGEPETFMFLGFIHICGKSRRRNFLLERKTRRARLRTKLQGIKEELRCRMHQPIPVQGGMVEAGRHRPLRILRCSYKWVSALSVPNASAPKSTRPLHLGPHDEAGGRMAPSTYAYDEDRLIDACARARRAL